MLTEGKPALIAWICDDAAAVVDRSVLRTRWWELVTALFASDAVVLPADCSWIFCYFHDDVATLAVSDASERYRLAVPRLS